MKLKTIYFLSMVFSGIACIILSFEAKPVVPLWHWFGYTFSIGSPLENWLAKLSFTVFLFLYLKELSKQN